MAITASRLEANQTLEEFRQEYNKLQDDVRILKDNPTYGSNMVFEGDIVDAYETTLQIVNPTADRLIYVPNTDGTLVVLGGSLFTVADGGTIGSVSDYDSMTIAGTGVITFSQQNKFTQGLIVNDGLTIGSVSSTNAITIAGTGVVTFVDDVLIKDGGTIGNASVPEVMSLAASGIVTFADDIIIKDIGTIGTATTPAAITIAANGNITFSGTPNFPNGSIAVDDLNIDDATDIGALLADTDLFIVDDGAAGTNRKTAASRIKTYIADVTLTTAAQTNITSLGILTALTVDNVIIDGSNIGHTGDTNLMVLSSELLTVNGAATVNGALTSTGTITGTSLTIGDAVLTEAEVELLDGITLGTAEASKAVVLDSSGDLVIADGDKWNFGTSSDMVVYHDGTNSYITNKTGILKIATETSGIALTIGHTTSEVTIGDNLTVAGNLTVQGTQTIVDTVTMNAANAIVFEGATPDDYETTLTITDPTADRTVTIPNETGQMHTSGGSITIPNAGTLGSTTTPGAIAIAADGVVTISGGINTNDDFTVDVDGNVVAVGLVTTGVMDFNNTTTTTSATSGAVQVAGGVGVAENIYAGGTITATGQIHGDATTTSTSVTTGSGVFDGGVGVAENIFAGGTINAAGQLNANATTTSTSVTTGAAVVDGGLGVAENIFAGGTINAAGVINANATTASSSKTTGALVVAGGIGTSADLYVGDLLNVEGGINIAGSNQELRFYEGTNYVGFEAPALSADKIWVLPATDASTSGDSLVSDGAGNLSFSSVVGTNAVTVTLVATNSTDAVHFPAFFDTATGTENPRTDTGYTYNPSSGLLSATHFSGTNLTGTLQTAAQANITSLGTLTSLLIADAGTIGSASDTDAMTIASDGTVTFSTNIVVTGTTTLNGALVLGDAAADTLTIGATIAGATPMVFEGATANGFETTFAIADPTAARTITFADITGTVITSGDTNTVTGTMIADNAIDSDHYVDGSIDTEHIADAQITVDKMKANSVDSDQYVDGSIDTVHLADDQVTEAKMADDAIGSVQMKTLSTLLIKNSAGTVLKTLHGAGA